MTHDEFVALSWIDQRRPTNLVAHWRWLGRNWASVGIADRSEICHALADWWEQPLLLRLLTVFDVLALHDRLTAVRRRMTKE